MHATSVLGIAIGSESCSPRTPWQAALSRTIPVCIWRRCDCWISFSCGAAFIPGCPSSDDGKVDQRMTVKTAEIEESALRAFTRLVSDALCPVSITRVYAARIPATGAFRLPNFGGISDAVRCFQTYADAQSRAARQMFGEAPFRFTGDLETVANRA